MDDDVFTRYTGNPILTPASLPIKANAVFNPGVAEKDGEVVLLLRVEDRQGISQIRTARSANGVDNWVIADRPLLEPDLPDYPFEEWGCEDARVTQVGPSDWMIAYTAYSRYGPAVALALTHDFDSVKRLGIVLSPPNKDAVLFPEKSVDGYWLMLHRPVTGEKEHIWYASAEHDLTHWSQPGILLPERGGPWWDGLRIGVGAPPIPTDQGWLLIFHGAKEMGYQLIYRLGVALLARDNPRMVLARASQWIFAPETDYEQKGLLPGVVYTCGTLQRGDETWMYYGAADTVIALATAKTSELVNFVTEHNFMHRTGLNKGMVPTGQCPS